jgi:hypothetical protein
MELHGLKRYETLFIKVLSPYIPNFGQGERSGRVRVSTGLAYKNGIITRRRI